MSWFTKKKLATGPLVWMLQKRKSDPPLFLGVCKDQLVTLSNWKASFRYSDIDSAGLMLYWLMQSGKIKPNEFEAVPVQLQPQGVKS